MTLFGIDVSHHQTGIDLRKVDTAFVFAKLTEGKSFKDSQFSVYARQAMETDLLFAGYHFLRGDSDPTQQAVNVASALMDAGTVDVPVVIDIERTNGSPQPNMRHAREFFNAASALGVRVASVLYLPEWYWSEIGRPDTHGWDLWQSDYGPNDGVYPGDGSLRWVTAGRQAQILQYSSNGLVPGYSGRIDVNAFRGTREELSQKGWFIDYKEHEVATKAEIQAWVATTPIIVDAENNTLPLQRVLRRLLSAVTEPEEPVKVPTAQEIAQAVVATLPDDVELTQAEVEEAVRNVFRSVPPS